METFFEDKLPTAPPEIDEVHPTSITNGAEPITAPFNARVRVEVLPATTCSAPSAEGAEDGVIVAVRAGRTTSNSSCCSRTNL